MSHTHVLAVDLSGDGTVWVRVNEPHVQLSELPTRSYAEPRIDPALSEWRLEPLVQPKTPVEVETAKAEAPEPETKAKPFWIFAFLALALAVLVTGGIVAQNIYNHYKFGS